MYEIVRQSISLIGATFGLWAFIMLQLEHWSFRGSKYLLACAVAGLFLTASAIIDKNIGFFVLNGAFTTFSIRGLLKLRQ
jgi:hypothetical protein